MSKNLPNTNVGNIEYISKQDAKDALQEKVFQNLTDEFYGAMQAIDELEPADVAPVVHARYVKPKGMMPPEHYGHYECSECGAWAGRDWLRPWKEILLTNFCPNCGAKMDGGDEHG